jgi:transaldolase
MAIYIDTVNMNEAKYAQSLGWVHGVTTNPLLLARTGGDPRDVLIALAQLNFKQLFYQLVSPTLESMYQEAQSISAIVEDALVLKVPPTEAGFQFVSRYGNVIPCCVTAVYSPAQAIVAGEAGARYIAVYVNRATRLMGDGLQLVQGIAGVLRGYGTEIIAASLKSTEEACASLAAGAHHLTLPHDVLESLITNPLSEMAVAEFKADGIGITSQEQVE